MEQLRKCIFQKIEIERIELEQVSNSKTKLLGIDQTLSIQSVSRGNQLSIGFFDRKKSKQKGFVAAILKGLRNTEVMSKPKD